MIHAKWCSDCKIVWQTRRVTCPQCRRRFTEDEAFTISKGRCSAAPWRAYQRRVRG